MYLGVRRHVEHASSNTSSFLDTALSSSKIKLYMSSMYIKNWHRASCTYVHSVYVRLLKELIPSGNCL